MCWRGKTKEGIFVQDRLSFKFCKVGIICTNTSVFEILLSFYPNNLIKFNDFIIKHVFRIRLIVIL